MELLPTFFPPLLSDMLSQKGEVLGLDRIKFDDFFLSAGALPQALALTPFWSDQDFRDLNDWCKKIECDPEDILLVLTSESRLRPDAMNPKTGYPLACGLNQMTRIAFQALGKLPSGSSAKDDQAKSLFPALAYATVKMPVKQQFEEVLIPYFKMCGDGMKGSWTAVKLYMANAAPTSLSKGDDMDGVIYAKGSDGYKGNPGLDTNGDGQITVQDLANAVNYHKETPEYVAAKYRYRKANGLPPFVNPALPGAWSLA
jgi:hypothetical protein